MDKNQWHIIATLPVLEARLSNQGIYGLIGRDILDEGILIYNGPSDRFALAF